MATTRELDIDLPGKGGRVGGLDIGPDPNAPPRLIFLHANGLHAGVYRRLLEPVAGEARVLAPNLRGHGARSLPPLSPPPRDWLTNRNDVLALMDAAATEPVVLAGHSMGAVTALLAAAARPHMVRALVMIEPVITGRRLRWAVRFPPAYAYLKASVPIAIGARKRRERFADVSEAFQSYRKRGAFKTWPDELLADYVRDGFVEDGAGVRLACPPAWEAANFLAQGHNPWAAFRAIAAPLSVIAGETGSTLPDWAADRLTGMLPQARFRRYSETTHFLPMERPEIVRASLRVALKS